MSNPGAEALQALINYCNEITGESNTTLSDAVESLVAGYGSGGGTDYLPMFLNDTLIEYSSDEITELPASAFQSKSIQRITLPNITKLSNYAFRYSKLTGIYTDDFPKLAMNGGWGFQGCTDLVFAVLKACNNIQISSFSGCTSLTVLDVGNPTLDGYSLQQSSLNGASALNKIVLRYKNVMQIQNLNAFTGTPFSSNGAGGTIYVPQSLLSAYQENSAWSTVLGYNANNQILSIEGSIYETQYADGTLIA